MQNLLWIALAAVIILALMLIIDQTGLYDKIKDILNGDVQAEGAYLINNIKDIILA